MCNSEMCQKMRAVPERHVVRYVCALCGNLIRERPQLKMLPAQTVKAAGSCCRRSVPIHVRHLVMQVEGLGDALPQQADERKKHRTLDSILGTEEKEE